MFVKHVLGNTSEVENHLPHTPLPNKMVTGHLFITSVDNEQTEHKQHRLSYSHAQMNNTRENDASIHPPLRHVSFIWGQVTVEAGSDIPLPSYIFQLSLGDPKTFLGQICYPSSMFWSSQQVNHADSLGTCCSHLNFLTMASF